MARKAKPNRDKGRPVRLSNEVLSVLDRKLRKAESYDSLLRRIIGLPSRNDEPQHLEVFWVLPSTLLARKSLAEARGEAVLAAVRKGKKKTEKPIKVVEYV